MEATGGKEQQKEWPRRHSQQRPSPRPACRSTRSHADGRLHVLAAHCSSGLSSPSEAASLHRGGGGLTFHIFGKPVALSPSPCIHTAAFRELGFPHTYTHFDSDDPSHVIRRCREASSGGGSVTIPLKESVIPQLDALSDSARKIGAVNTITKLRDGTLLGDNTDWLGIQTGLEARRPVGDSAVGLVCGAGGTARAACYALQKMGLRQVLILNPRTPSRADAVAADFRSSGDDADESWVRGVVSGLAPHYPSPSLQSSPSVFRGKVSRLAAAGQRSDRQRERERVCDL